MVQNHQEINQCFFHFQTLEDSQVIYQVSFYLQVVQQTQWISRYCFQSQLLQEIKLNALRRYQATYCKCDRKFDDCDTNQKPNKFTFFCKYYNVIMNSFIIAFVLIHCNSIWMENKFFCTVKHLYMVRESGKSLFTCHCYDIQETSSLLLSFSSKEI